jgi:hypothetical protein
MDDEHEEQSEDDPWENEEEDDKAGDELHPQSSASDTDPRRGRKRFEQIPQDVLPEITKLRPANYFRITDKIYIHDLRKMILDGCFENTTNLIQYLKLLVRYIESGSKYIIKEKDGALNLAIYSSTAAKSKLNTMVLHTTPRYTLWDYIQSRLPELTVTKVTLFSYDPEVFSTFGGYCVPVGLTIPSTLPYLFDQLLFEGICNSDKMKYDYLNNWIAFVVQNPGARTKVHIILKGLPRVRTHHLSFLSLPPRHGRSGQKQFHRHDLRNA